MNPNQTIITSRKNPKVALYRALMRNKKTRDEERLFAVEGEKLFHEAVNSGLIPQGLLLSEKFLRKNKNFYENAAKVCNKCGIEVISDGLAEYISDTKSPQGVFFLLPLLDKSANLTKIKDIRFIILDGVSDPGNVGAIIRSCDAFGIDGLFMSEDCADIHSPKVIRSSMGSVFRLPLYKAKLTEILPKLKQNGTVIIGADLNEKSESLCEFEFPENCAVVIGSEGGGISREVKEFCGRRIFIPVKNVESLNAAVAASIITYEMRGN